MKYKIVFSEIRENDPDGDGNLIINFISLKAKYEIVQHESYFPFHFYAHHCISKTDLRYCTPRND